MQVLQGMALFLVASSVIALPLRAYLMRTWQLPVLAATVAAFTAWFVTPLLYCSGLWLLSR